jgi:hypothetical protein
MKKYGFDFQKPKKEGKTFRNNEYLLDLKIFFDIIENDVF